MSEHNSIISSPRPLRVAYLVDKGACDHILLDVLFRESYGRWAGRRTLIVPASKDSGIDPDYAEWLLLYDADIIYSYLDLTADVIADIHEIYCPLFLKRHQIYGGQAANERSLTPELPLDGVTSLSILPMIKERRGILDSKTRKVLDKDFGYDASRFLTDNFGFITHTYRNENFANFPEIYTPLRLITTENLENPRHGKFEHAEYITDELQALREMGKRNLFSMSMLSDAYAPYLELGHYHEASNCFNLVIGDTVEDRLLYWNYHQKYGDLIFGEIADLIISPDLFENEDILKAVLEIVRIKCFRNNSNPSIAIRSQSLSQDQLNKHAEQLKSMGNHVWISKIEKITAASDYINVRPDREKPNYRSGFAWNTTKIDVTDFYTGDRIIVPKAIPLHFKDVSVTPAFRQGVWMLDLVIQRHMTHSRVSNVPHIWMLPRRLRLDKFFKHDYESIRENYDLRTLRVNRDYIPSLPVKYDSENIILHAPEDQEAFGGASIAHYEWEHFSDPQNETVFSRPRFYEYRISDKGRYLRGVLRHFDSLFNAENIILNKFWYDVFVSLGTSPKRPSEMAVTKVKKYISRFLLQNRESFLENSEQQEKFADFSLRAASDIAKDRFFISWEELRDRWETSYKEWVTKNPSRGENDHDEYYYNRYIGSLEDSTQYLCQNQILFQGQLWQCPECLNRNWVSIEDLGATLTCEICTNNKAAPISEDWKFFLNGFILQAMQKHGVTAAIWCLVQLNQRARSSFYYIPSIEFYDQREDDEKKNNPVAEADLMAVVDGKLYVCEVKSSGRDNDFTRFLKVVERLRPDVALIAIMDDDPKIPGKLRKALTADIPDNVGLEIMAFNSDNFDDTPLLPSGKNILLRIL